MLDTSMKTLSLTMLSLFASVAHGQQAAVPRILGGTTTPAPSWMVAIGNDSDGQWRNYCGGTLIAKDWVLTAAHCLEEAKLDGMQVAIGVSDLSKPHARIRVDQIIMHDTYLSGFTRNIGTGHMEADSDIALLHLSTASKNNTLPISAKEMPADYNNGSRFSAWGYGGINPDASLASPQLLRVELAFQGFRDRWMYDNTQTHIFAGNIAGQDTCRGDSGGPLTDQSGLVGITSYGSQRCGLGQPGGYTFAPLFRDWLAEKMNAVSLTSHQLVALPAGQHSWVSYTVLNGSAEAITLNGATTDAPAMRNECPPVLAAGEQCRIKLRFDANFTPDTYQLYRLRLNATQPNGASQRLDASLIAVTTPRRETDAAIAGGSSSGTESHNASTTSSGGGGSIGLLGLLLLPLAWRRRA